MCLGMAFTSSSDAVSLMSAELEAAAKSAGLVDMDLVKIAKPGLAPTDAVQDLRKRYPLAFPQIDARKMTQTEFDAGLRRLIGEDAETRARRVREHLVREQAKGSVRNLSQKEVDKRFIEFLGGLR